MLDMFAVFLLFLVLVPSVALGYRRYQKFKSENPD